MYKIGICDDDQKFCQQIKNYLLEYSEKKSIKIDLELFFTAEEYLKYLSENEPLDLLFLDIELGKINGVKVGKIVRKSIENELTQIVYVSFYESYAMELFQVRPMEFLIKPVYMKHIEKIMDNYMRLYTNQKGYLIYHVGKQQHRIAEEHILYLKSQGRKIYIVTRAGEKEFYGKLSEVSKQLNEKKFCVVHKSFVINMNYVLEYRVDEVVMINEDRISISQSMRKNVKEKILERNIAERDW